MRAPWLLGIGMLLLSACGFHLRGSQGHMMILSQTFPTLSIQLTEELQSFTLPLKTALRQSGIQLVETNASATLVLLEYKHWDTPLAYGIEGETRRERLEGSLSFKVVSDAPQLTLPTMLVNASRDRYRYLNFDLSDAEEKQAVLTQLQSDLIYAMFRQIALTLSPGEKPS